MFDRLKLIIKNRQLTKENLAVYEENKKNREDIVLLKLKTYHASKLANETLECLCDLQEIDRMGNDEKIKIQMRNSIINRLRIKNIDMIKELDACKTY